MSAEQLLSDLEEHDVTVSVRGERLRIEAPRGVITEELRCALSRHKPEILRLLREKVKAPTSPTPVDEEQVEAMTLDAFASAGLVVEVHSDVLGRNILFVSDNVHESSLTDLDLPVYRASELRKLAILQPTPRALRCIHGVKAVFGGAITDVRPRDDQD